MQSSGTAARLGQCRAANQFKSVAAADAQVFRLDRRDRKNIRQIENADQPGFAIAQLRGRFPAK